MKDYYKIVLVSKAISQQAKPGQFVHVRVSDKTDPLLRRPLSIYRVGHKVTKTQGRQGYFEILYEVKGQGTRLLSQKKTGECLDVIGPLGNGFALDPRPTTHDKY